MKTQSKTQSTVWAIMRLVVVFTFLLQMTSIAYADNTIVEGDTVWPVSDTSDLSFGTICQYSYMQKPVWVAIKRTGGVNNNTFANSRPVYISASAAPASLPYYITGPNPIVLPGNWTTIGNGSMSSDWGYFDTIYVTLTPAITSAIGAFNGTLTVKATGTRASDFQQLVQTTAITVSANVVSCDTTPPTLNLPSNVSAEATGPNGAAVAFTATATDTNPVSPVVSCTPPSGATFPLDAVSTVVCTAVDAAGNRATGGFSVWVHDFTPPAISGTPADITAEATSSAGSVVTYSTPTAADMVDGPSLVSCMPASGSTFALGTTQVICTAYDRHSNRGNTSFNVTVQDTLGPILSLSDLSLEAAGPTGAVVTYTASASDAVDGKVPTTCAPISGSTFALGSTLVTCSAADSHNNTTLGTFNITITDTTAPSLSLPEDITAEAEGASGAAVSYSVSAMDIVDGPVTPGCSPASGETFPLDLTTPVTCSATDSHENIATGSFNVSVVDTTAPGLSVPADITSEATGADGATVSFTPTATDLVDGVVAVTCSPASGSTFAIGTTSVACSSEDTHGNKAAGGFFVTIADTTEPELALPASFSVEATGPSGAAATFSASASDLVDGNVAVSCSPASGSIFALGENTVTCSATDAHNNTATGSFKINIVDTTPPVLKLSADLLLEATSPDGAAATFETSADDLVDGSVAVSCSWASGAIFPLGTTTVECTATDAHKNIAKGSFSVKVQDTTPPALNLPSDITAEATGSDGAVVNYAATATDVVDGNVAVNCDPASDSKFALDKITTVTCSAADKAGNKAEGMFKVSVVDTTAPVIADLKDITEEATGPNGAVATFTATATDVVDGNVEVKCEPASGSTFILGETRVVCTAVDKHSNAATRSFTVIVQDTTAPVLVLPADITEEATSAAGATATFTPSATDIVDGKVAVTCDPKSGATFPLGETKVNCSATDAHLNTASGAFKVTVVDTTPPALTLPKPIAEATGPQGAIVTFKISALDIVDGAVAVTCDKDSGATFPLGATTVNCSATDAHGNKGTGNFTVTVQDTTPPTLTVPGAISVNPISNSSAVVTFIVTASDIVDGSVVVTCTPASGSVFNMGDTTVNCTATDAHSNTGKGSFIVTVTYNWNGFFRPVENPSVLNSVKAGSSVPIKFSLTGNQGLNILTAGYPKSSNITCGAYDQIEPVDQTVTAGSSSLTYDVAADQYIYVWKTDKTWAGTCRQFGIKLADGSYHWANFKFTK